MPSDSEKAITWLRDQVVSPDTPPTIREELKRRLQAYRQSADDVFEEEPASDEALDQGDVPPLRC
jgi:hypothetical protein